MLTSIEKKLFVVSLPENNALLRVVSFDSAHISCACSVMLIHHLTYILQYLQFSAFENFEVLVTTVSIFLCISSSVFTSFIISNIDV